MSIFSNQKPYFASPEFLDPGVRQLLLFSVVMLAMMSLWLVASCYTVIPTLEEAAKAKWLNTQKQYQLRLDLMSNLVATEQVYANQEKPTLNSVTATLAKATASDIDPSQLTDPAKMYQFEQTQEQVSDALNRLLVVGQNNSDFKSKQSFLAFQAQLAAAQKSIAVARHGYVEFSRRYNIALKELPTLLLAKTFFANKLPFAEFSIKSGDD